MSDVAARRTGRTSVLVGLTVGCLLLGALAARVATASIWTVGAVVLAGIVGLLVVRLRHQPFVALIVAVTVEGAALIAASSDAVPGPADLAALAMAFLPVGACYHLGRNRPWPGAVGITVLACLVLMVLTIGGSTERAVMAGGVGGQGGGTVTATVIPNNSVAADVRATEAVDWARTGLGWGSITVLPCGVGALVRRGRTAAR